MELTLSMRALTTNSTDILVKFLIKKKRIKNIKSKKHIPKSNIIRYLSINQNDWEWEQKIS